MPDDKKTAEAVALGRQKADAILAQRQIARATRRAALAAHAAPLTFRVQMDGAMPETTHQTAGFLVAAGDSWFDYPFHDVLKLLDDEHGYNIESAAHRGDRMEQMAYHGGQIDQLSRCLDKITAQGGVPKAVLLSGGGDDIAGQEFGMLLNSVTSGIAGWNTDIVDGVLNERILAAYHTMLGAIAEICEQQIGRTLPVLVHGYGYPVPDGRGFLWGWPFPGPWLEPGFREKGFDQLPDNVQLMHTIIDEFNTMLAGLAHDPAVGHVHYVDLRPLLSDELANDRYQVSWANELHPTKDGFSAVAAKFATVLSTL